jgi:hypothetical protein
VVHRLWRQLPARSIGHRQLSSITRCPPGVDQPDRVLCYHTHRALGIWLKFQIRLFKPIPLALSTYDFGPHHSPSIVLNMRLWVLRCRPSSRHIRRLLLSLGGRFIRLKRLERVLRFWDAQVRCCPCECWGNATSL